MITTNNIHEFKPSEYINSVLYDLTLCRRKGYTLNMDKYAGTILCEVCLGGAAAVGHLGSIGAAAKGIYDAAPPAYVPLFDLIRRKDESEAATFARLIWKGVNLDEVFGEWVREYPSDFTGKIPWDSDEYKRLRKEIKALVKMLQDAGH